MKASSKESKEKSSSFWDLEQKLGVLTWRNLLALPETDQRHAPEKLRLEQTLGFTYVDNSTHSRETATVFVSERTDFANLCRFLPFLFENYQIYLCADRLIQERLHSLDRDEMFQGDNKATNNLFFLLEKAAHSNASDIHIESLPGGKQVRIRIDGNLQKIDLPEDIDESLFIKIKLHSGMDIAQKRAPQDGHFPFISDQGKRFDLRTSTVPGVNGEKIVVRLLPSASVQFSMQQMGFSAEHSSTVQRNIVAKTGMILFTGPTGSGKTTSLYAILKELMSESLNIITIEDPVEYRLNNITQVEVNDLAGISFSSALRSFLRQDPDVILVGEIRDQETAQIAARAAQTGHLVLSTLHSNNVFEAVHRLKSLGVEGDDIASSLKLLVSQRLVTRLCSCGRRSDCPDCSGKGSIGRIPIMEILEISPSIRKLLSYGSAISEIEKQAVEEGFVSLRKHGEKLAGDNRISLLELDTVCSR
ncbi:MAG: type II/IV secretion system protein [Proteobacteria bacterium]|nr:type II/IV secretion system protein [Pseudomonadota bacterium]